MGGVTNISANRTDSDWEQTCQTHNTLTDRKCRLLVSDNVTYLYSGVTNWGHCDSLHQVALLDAFPSGKDEKRVAQKKTRLRLQTITGENIQNSNCGNCDDTQCQESQKQTNIRQSRPQVVGLDLLTLIDQLEPVPVEPANVRVLLFCWLIRLNGDVTHSARVNCTLNYDLWETLVTVEQYFVDFIYTYMLSISPLLYIRIKTIYILYIHTLSIPILYIHIN